MPPDFEQVAQALPLGPGELRLRALRDGAWVPLGGALNRDPTHSASEPSIAASFDPSVAWIEDGQVLIRRPSATGVLGDPEALNADPAASARAPRISLGRVAFLERGASGDAFQVRERDDLDTAWVSLPPLDAGGDVTSYDVQFAKLYLEWTDAAGAVRIRAYNDPR